VTVPRTRWLRACEWILAGAAPVVPADMRRDWMREWHAELAHRATRQSHAGLPLVVRSCGALAHAAWLRWDRWRLEMLLQDVRYAARTLIRKPGFAVITVLTLALGIGANTAIFSAVRAVLLRPLPFPQPDALVFVSSTTVAAPTRAGGAASPPDFVDWRQQNRSFTELAALYASSYALTGVGTAEQIPGATATGGLFNILGVPALYGRTLDLSDDAIGGADVAVIGHGLWSRRFGSDPSIVGRTVMLDGVERRIVGVMPRGFAFPLESELWVPLRLSERELATQRGAHYLEVVGRLKDGVSLEQAAGDMNGIVRQLAAAYPRTNRDKRAAVHTFRDALVGDVRPALFMLLGAVGFVLLIVCVNVANLVLTRALGRTREMAIRTALGAGRFRLVRGVLVESLLLATIGGVAGLGVAIWAARGIAALQRGLDIPLLDQTRIDPVVIAFTAVVSIAAALLCGTLPAWHTSALGQLAQRIRADGGTGTGDRKRHRLRATLIVTETAVAVVLLVGAGLLLRSFMRLTSVELGIDTAGVQTFNISLPETRYSQPMQRAEFVSALLDDLARQPGVDSAGAIFGLPLSNTRYTISMSTLDGRRLSDEEQDRRSLQVRVATPDYFRTLRIPLVQGRPFTASDRLGAPYVVIVNETAAKMLWPSESALGHQFTLGTRMGQEGANAGGVVVGVARDVRDFGARVPARPTVYLAHAQFPVDSVAVTVRGGAGSSLLEPLRAVVQRHDADVPIFRVRTMEQLAADAVAQPRVYMLLLGLFAATAVVLAALGIYGVLAHAVSQRTREIGIRLALGAGRYSVVTMVVRQAAGLAIAGLTIGLGLALAAGGAVQNLLFGVEPTDTTTYLSVAVGLLLIALAASYVPARRAAGVDPVRALRYD
jgi:putative ABC transport system permease protein